MEMRHVLTLGHMGVRVREQGTRLKRTEMVQAQVRIDSIDPGKI